MNQAYMKIVSLELVNFSRVYSGIGKTRVFIDLLNSDNEINLFLGANGSGKSSIMGCFHPFAYNSAIGDNTSNSDLIIEGKDGKKEIVITYGEDVYRIQHIYTRKKDGTISVKSYIMKNNEELNDSGTVTTFKSIIYQELGINETFLTLLSIGNRVNGFVEFTSGERKKYATKIFSELDVINEYYKRMTVKSRKMKTLLSNVTSKLSKYRNYDKTELEMKLKDITVNIKKLNDSKSIISQDIGGIETQLKDLKDVVDKYDGLQREAEVIMNRISDNRRNKVNNLTYSQLVEEKDKLVWAKHNTEVSVTELSTKVNANLDFINSSLNRIDKINEDIRKLGTLEDIRDLENTKYQLTEEINQLSSLDYTSVKGLSKEDLVRATIYLDRAADICSKLIFDTESEDNILDLFEKFKVDNKIYDKVNKKFNDSNVKLQSYLSTTSTMMEVALPKIKEYADCKSTDGCPYVTFYNTFVKIATQTEAETQRDMRNLRNEVSNYQNELIILGILKEVSQYLLDNQKYLNLPRGIFQPDTFIQRYVQDRTIYDNDVLTTYIDLIESRDRLEKLNQSLELVNMKLDKYNDIKALSKRYQTQLDLDSAEIATKTEENDKLVNDVNELNADLETIKYKLDILTKDIELQTEIDDFTKKIDSINEEVKSIQSKISKVDSLNQKLYDLRLDRNRCDANIMELETQKSKLSIILNDIITLQNEELTIREDYDNILMIQDAVSPTKGIPVEFIEFYMRHEMIDKMNDLLDSVYHGELVLLKDEMVIDENEFRIPYKKRNTIVSDISKASDGERAILTITFSLVLIQLSLDKYNIMLLDEIDTSLDYKTRGKFLDLLERYMSIIGAKQLFLISHNNMFDTYPVNAIMTSEQNISSMKNAYSIKLY